MSNLFAQQEPMSAQFQNTLVHINPAMASIHQPFEANILCYYQSENITGNPSSFFANYSNYLKQISGAIGMSYSYNKIGLFSEHKALTHYSYHLKLNRKIKVSAGLALGLSKIAIQSGDWIMDSGQINPDNSLKFSDVTFQINSGILVSSKKWRIGVSATQINQPVFHLDNGVDYKGAMQGYVFGECNFQFNREITLLPSLKIGTDFNFYSYSSLVRLKTDRLLFGLSFGQRYTSNYLGVLLGYKFNDRYELTYSYDYAASRLDNLRRTHGFSLAIRWRNSHRIGCRISNWSF